MRTSLNGWYTLPPHACERNELEDKRWYPAGGEKEEVNRPLVSPAQLVDAVEEIKDGSHILCV
eukprot:2484357-Amphidinium_carterae.2